MGVDHQYRSSPSGSGVEVQTTVASGGCLPLDEVAAGHSAHLPQARRNHTWAVFCSFLALVLRKELEDRLGSKNWKLEWADVIRDVDNLTEMEIAIGGKSYVFCSEDKGSTNKDFPG